jgi:hypothetical protein
MKWPNGLGFNNKDPRYFIKIKRIICDNNPALVTLTHCRMKLERNTNGKYSVGMIFPTPENKMSVSNVEDTLIKLIGHVESLVDSSK